MQDVADEVSALGRKATVFAADVTDRSQVYAAVDHAESALGSFDIMINDAHHIVTWGGKADVSGLAGRPIRLHFKMRSAKLYAFQFVKP